MARKKQGINEKKAAGRELKAANSKVKADAQEREREKVEAAEWKKGSNVKGNARAEVAAGKADDAARKRREKAELLAAEEESNGPGAKVKKNSNIKSKKKKRNDLSFLEEALTGDAEKKIKAAKKVERVKKEREERLRLERENQKAVALKSRDPLLLNTDTMLMGTAGIDDNGGCLNTPLGEEKTSGIDAALGTLSLGDMKNDEHPEKRMKAMHKAFTERMMPEMKNDYPGLKMSQYKEKIFQLWKKSPENPLNFPKGGSSR